MSEPEPICDEDGVYCCPFCGFNYTHHRKIEVFGRNEDDESPNHVIVNTYNIAIDRDNTGNPSSRREGISIQFWCENCWRVHYLTIAQHKGNTYMEIVNKNENYNPENDKVTSK